MTPRAFVQPGTAEAVKLAVHGIMLLGAGACAAYNIVAWCYRRETHNAVNGIVYTGLFVLELKHVQHHADPTT